MSDINIPSELLREILVRLPAESLHRFRSVCKKWVGIIDDSSFIKAHALLNSNQLYSHTLLLLMKKNTYSHRHTPLLYSFSLDSLQFMNAPQMIDAKIISPPRLGYLFHYTFCNGLILMHSISDTTKYWIIWNPLTSECRRIPMPPLIHHAILSNVAFGFDCDADDYKVVRIDLLVFLETPIKFGHRTLVYSLKLDSWRKIEDCPRSIPSCPEPATFFNGTLYWLLNDTVTALALDIRTESFFELPLPDDITSQQLRGCRLDALDGCLICSLENEKTKTFNAWMMKEDNDGWTKLFSLQFSHLLVSGTLRLVAYLKRKGQVVMQHCEMEFHNKHKRGFMWLDIGSNSVNKLSIHGIPDIDSSKIYPLSLVRLNVCDTKDVSATRSKLFDTRLRADCVSLLHR